MLHDFRLLREQGSSELKLIIAEREFGNGYADSAPVKFKHYRLHKNGERDIGRPLYYFELIRTEASKKHYCDVEQAFSEEFGVANYRKTAG